MPDPNEHDTDPEIPIPEEPPTRPDVHLSTLQRCPRCKGDGRVLEANEQGTLHSRILRVCTLCGGRMSVTAQQIAERHATRMGRPPSSPT